MNGFVRLLLVSLSLVFFGLYSYFMFFFSLAKTRQVLIRADPSTEALFSGSSDRISLARVSGDSPGTLDTAFPENRSLGEKQTAGSTVLVDLGKRGEKHTV